MKLDDTISEQVEALVTWMLGQAELVAPGPAEHAERTLAMKEHAWFLREIVLPKVQVQGRMATLSIAEGVNGMANMPARPDGLKRNGDFLRAGLPKEEQAPDPVEGVSEVFPAESIPGAVV